MDKIDLTISVLAGIALIGVIVLSALKLDTSVLTPIMTTLIGALLGIKKPAIVSGLGRLVGKKK